MIVIWTAAAVRQLDEIFTYWEIFNPYAAGEVYDRLLEAGNSLESLHQRGRSVPHTGYREIVAVRPYALRYRVTETTVYILRLRHTSRK